MFLYNLIGAIGSLFKCFGTHNMRSVTVFLSDPNGPDMFHGFPSDPPGLPPAGLFGSSPNDPINRGRYETYGRCRRCGLRDDGKGFDL